MVKVVVVVVADGCFVIGNERRVLCNLFSDGDVNGVLTELLSVVVVAVKGSDLVDDALAD